MAGTTASITVTATDRTSSGFSSVKMSMDNLKKVAVGLSPALIPVAAALAPVAAGAAAAGIAVGVLGAAMAPQIMEMAEAAKAEKKYTDALEEHGPASEKTAKAQDAYLRSVQKLPPSTREAAAALSVLKDQYKGWSDATAKDTMPLVTKSFGIFGALLPKLTPLVQGAANEFDRLMNRLGAGLQTRGFDDFLAKFTDFAVRSLHNAVDGAIKLQQALASGTGSEDFRSFLAYARENGPLVAETLKNLVKAIANLVEGLASSGVSILTVVNAFAELVAALPPSFISLLIQGYAAFKLFSLGVAAVSAVTSAGLISRLVTYFGVLRADGVVATMRGVAHSMTAVQKAGVGLAVLGIVAIGISKLAERARGAPPDVDRLTTSLKRLADTGKFTGELKKSFGDIDGLVKKIGDLGNAAEEQQKYLERFGSVRIGPIDDLRRKVHGLFDDLVDGEKSLNALEADFKALDEAMSQLAKSGHADIAAENFRLIAEAAQKQGYSLKDVKKLLPEYQAAVAALQADQAIAARSMGLFGEQAIEVKAKLDAQKQSTDGLRQAIQALNDVNRQALGGMIGFEAAIDAAAKAAQENAGSLRMVNGQLDLNDEKSRNAATALSDLATKTDEAAASARENGSSWLTVNGIYERGRQQLIANARQMGLTEAQARALANQILKTPDKTAMLKGNLSDLQAKLADAKRRLASVPDSRKAAIRGEIGQLQAAIRQAQAALAAMRKNYTITVHYRTTGSPYPPSGGHREGRAHGGIIGAAGGGPRSRMTLVGEQGPELVDLAPGSRVRSNPDSRRMLAGGGGGPSQPIVVQVMLDGQRMAQAMVDPMRHEVRTRGGDVQSVLGQRQ